MSSSMRAPRLLQRLSVPRPAAGPSRPLLSRASQARQTCCTLCQFRSQTSPRHYTTMYQQTRRLTTTAPTASPAQNTNTKEDIHATTSTPTPDITNYYTMFPNTIPSGPPPASPFAIPIADLRREFLSLQNVIHPDKYPQGAEKQRAEALSARTNEAFRTLADPLSRAQYLLREMHGIDVTAEDGASKHALDPETLMEVMEVQETIEEVGTAPDAEGTIVQMKKENDERVRDCVEALGEAFDRGDVETARKECVRLRFWYSVGQGLHEWEPGMTEIRLVH
ncbi:Co-chaperone Hsc20 [Aspergillus campestris IBT 28561]|uniref:Co-chaperone Hsc20 n=1 Tax=Aspergillus campestris (strain IBT 28561) TaxID=1392248 RepID=A0A2I1DAU8_ASPC2|nr:Co-chaperone Hsc20 [Aspergillus campestris IBT 28561]PKY07003.1 Co-chaperone Hsc20 [Aspergillus campestris IBT 28561]